MDHGVVLALCLSGIAIYMKHVDAFLGLIARVVLGWVRPF